jgi:hypothetical protein
VRKKVKMAYLGTHPSVWQYMLQYTAYETKACTCLVLRQVTIPNNPPSPLVVTLSVLLHNSKERPRNVKTSSERFVVLSYSPLKLR